MQGGAHHGSSYGEAMSAELRRLQAKQLKRLHQAAEAAQVDLGPGWTTEVKVRQQGTTAGIVHIQTSMSDRRTHKILAGVKQHPQLQEHHTGAQALGLQLGAATLLSICLPSVTALDIQRPLHRNASDYGAGTTDTYYRSNTGKRFRSIKAALEHMGKPVVQVKSSKKDAPSKPAPEKHEIQKPPSPIRHHTSKLIIKGSMLRAATGPGQATAADTANAQASTHEAAQADKQAEGAPKQGDIETPVTQPATQSQSTAGPTNPGNNSASMSGLLAPAGNSTPGIKQAAAPESSQGKADPEAPTPGQPLPSSAKRGTTHHPPGLSQGSRGRDDSMDVKQKAPGETSLGQPDVKEQGSGAAQAAETAADAKATAEQCTGHRAADEKHIPSLAVNTTLGTGRRKRKSAFSASLQPCNTSVFWPAVHFYVSTP